MPVNLFDNPPNTSPKPIQKNVDSRPPVNLFSDSPSSSGVSVQRVDPQSVDASQQGSMFPVSRQETFTPLGAVKAVGNVPQGVWNFVKGTINFLNPISNLKTIGEAVNPFSDLYKGGAPNIVAPATQGGTYSIPQEMNGTTLDLAKSLYSNVPKEAYKRVVPQSIQKALSGDITGAVNQLENHPEEAAQIYYSLKGAAHAVDSMKWNAGDFETQIRDSMPDATLAEQNQAVASAKANFFDSGFTGMVEKLSAPSMAATRFGLNLTGKALGSFANFGNNLAKFGTAQATGLSPSTISEIIGNPENFSKQAMSSLTREAVGQEVVDTINQRISDLSETGKEYGNIRESATPIQVDPNWLDNTIKENTGLTIEKQPVATPKGGVPTIDESGNPIMEPGGKLVSSGDAEIRQPGDVSKLQQFYDRYQPMFEKGQMNANQFLNMRADLAKLAKYEGGIGKSTDLENLSSIMRGQLNSEYRDQVSGLENLDKQFGPEVQQLNKLKKDYFNSDGTIKDNAFSKIANLTNRGRETVLDRLDQVSPGIGEKIAAMKAIEDIQNAAGQKVGTYARATITGGGLVATLLNPAVGIPAVVGAILTSPGVATEILRGYGKLLGVKDVALTNIVNSYSTLAPQVLESASNFNELKSPAGMSLEDVSQNPESLGQQKITNIDDFEKAPNLTPADKRIETAAFQKVLSSEDKILQDYIAKHGNVANADNFRPFFQNEGYNGTNAAAVQEPASYLNKRLWTKLLTENPGDNAVLYSGGGGVGKSSGIKAIPEMATLKDGAAAILDGNLSKLSSATDRINEAIDNGKLPHYIYVYRNPLDAFEHGVVERMLHNPEEMGRLVPISELVKNHTGSLETIKSLYDEAPSSAKQLFHFIDNSDPRGPQYAKMMDIADVKKISYPANLKDILMQKAKELYNKGTINEEQYKGYIK